MNILLSAFKGVYNSSYQLIRECENDKLLFTNSYDGIDRDIEEFDFDPYLGVIMFGIDPRLKDKIRIEPKAARNGNVCKTAYDVGDFSDIFEIYGLQVTIAKRATSYLCNYAYYRVLEIMNGRALFIHIPPEQYLTEDLRTGLQNAIHNLMEAAHEKV